MIRLIRRRLIIPRGDTGSFSIPTQGSVSEGDIAVFGIFDQLTHKTVVMKVIAATEEYLTIPFVAEDTINLEPRKYNWDITIYRSPEYDEDGELIGAAEVHSYYSAFKLPVCEITEVALDMNKERWKTRDLLVDSSKINTPFSSIKTVYPWENMQLDMLSKQIYQIAQNYGYSGDEKAFWDKFSNGPVVISTVDEFPVVGEEDRLYLDKESGILYYFIATTNVIYHELANALDVNISGENTEEDQTVTYLYIPIKAMPIENLILSGGDING